MPRPSGPRDSCPGPWLARERAAALSAWQTLRQTRTPRPAAQLPARASRLTRHPPRLPRRLVRATDRASSLPVADQPPAPGARVLSRSPEPCTHRPALVAHERAVASFARQTMRLAWCAWAPPPAPGCRPAAWRANVAQRRCTPPALPTAPSLIARQLPELVRRIDPPSRAPARSLLPASARSRRLPDNRCARRECRAPPPAPGASQTPGAPTPPDCRDASSARPTACPIALSPPAPGARAMPRSSEPRVPCPDGLPASAPLRRLPDRRCHRRERRVPPLGLHLRSPPPAP